MIHLKLCKRLRFDHTIKLYMHKPESVLENEMNTILWDFDIQTDHLIPARRPDLVLIDEKKKKKKKNLPSSGFCCFSGSQSEK